MLVVLGDGTARRTDKAPGHLDERAEAYDAALAAALASGRPEQLATRDTELADALLVTATAPWTAVAHALRRDRYEAQLLYTGAPFGVGYLVATWTRSERTPVPDPATRVVAVVGPTATGKSDLAVALAQQLGR